MSTAKPPLTRATLVRCAGRNVSASIGSGRHISLSLTQSKYFELNAVARRIFEILSDTRSVGDIVELIRAEFDGPHELIERDTHAFVQRLIELGLVEIVVVDDH